MPKIQRVVDAKHYKVTFENDQVRILKITYGPKEKTVKHEHRNAVAVFLTDFDSTEVFGLRGDQVLESEELDLDCAERGTHRAGKSAGEEDPR